MTAPHPARCLRQIDRKHVDSLKAAFRKRPENNIIFFGNILKDDFDIRLLGTSGYVNVETIGGNHSRVALQELLEEGINMSPTVYMTIYKGLCDTEALKLGFDHNVGHELGRPTSPEELMLLFRRELLKLIDEVELNNPQNSSMKTWKQTCADILGIYLPKQNYTMYTIVCYRLPLHPRHAGTGLLISCFFGKKKKFEENQKVILRRRILPK